MSEPARLREFVDNNPAIMAQVVAGLVQGRTVSDIAETLGVNRNKITAWYRDSETFRELLAETQGAVIDQIRAEVVRETADELTNMLPAAVAALKEVLEPDSEAKTTEKLAAAAHVIRFSGLGGRKEAPKPGPSPEDLIRGARGPATGD